MLRRRTHADSCTGAATAGGAVRGAGPPASSLRAARLFLPAAHSSSSSACLTAEGRLGKDRGPSPLLPAAWGAPLSGNALSAPSAALLRPGCVSGAGARSRGGGAGGREASAPKDGNSLLRGEVARRPDPEKPAGLGWGQSGAERDAAARWRRVRRVFLLKLAGGWEPARAGTRGRVASTALDSPRSLRRAVRGRRRTAEPGGTVRRRPASGSVLGVGWEPADPSAMEAARGGAD